MEVEPSTQEQVKSLESGGIWTGDNNITDGSWTGEDGTKTEKVGPTTDKGKAPVIAPKTPAQEDKDQIERILGDPTIVAALTREIERKMLRESGRSIQMSMILQLTKEREEGEARLRDWIAEQQTSQAVRANNESRSAEAKIRSLEEKLITLENKMQELQTTTVFQQSEEKLVVDEAIKIVMERRREEAESDNTPSEINRMTERSKVLEEQIDHIRNQLPIAIQSKTTSAAAKNKKKFGSLF